MRGHLRWLVIIAVVVAFALWVSLPDTQGISWDTDNNGEIDVSIPVRQSLGLDLVGGLRVLLEAELSPDSFTTDDLRQTANNVARRVNGLGVGEATVQVQGENRILVELPGFSDPDQAIETIQQTALLEFVDFGGLGSQARELEGRRILTTEQVIIQQQRDAAQALEATAEGTPGSTLEATPEATSETISSQDNNAATPTPTEEAPLLNPLTGEPFQTIMTGAGLQAAAAQFDQQQGWYIQFELTGQGGEVFGPFTAARIGEPLAIVLDGEVLSAPIIQDALPDGGIITGNFTEEEAKQLALQLRSGALPIPLRVETAESVGATLGQESVNLSIRAGIIGVIVVLAFMLIYYRVPGIAADLALFKLIPITLTLPAITGFLISIGTAVDGNILIFERIKEEIRAGRDLETALQAGFDRAWNSIRDSNLSTIIISAILFLFGQTPGASIVSGFAVTLALGLMLNLFTAVIVTRTFLHLLAAILRQPLIERKWLLGV